MTPEISKQLLFQMKRIRFVEEEIARRYPAGAMRCPTHLSVGQEAVAASVGLALRHEDMAVSGHRAHAHYLGKGGNLKAMLAEIYGKATGCSQGRGGSMHLFSPEVGMMGTSGIVAPCILQATGAGYSFKLLASHHVGVAFFGDGAVANGAFHEGINLATNWQLPVLFVCENNQFATEVAFADTTRNPEVANRAAAYGLPGIAIDGNNVDVVYQTAGEAIERARNGGGPTLIECKTYRTRPHAEGMRDGGYRALEEIEAWKQRDPITTFAERLITEQRAEQGEIDAIGDEVTALVAEALQFAHDSPWPDPATGAGTRAERWWCGPYADRYRCVARALRSCRRS